MANQSQNSNRKKFLGQNPLAGLDDFGFDEPDLLSVPASPKPKLPTPPVEIEGTETKGKTEPHLLAETTTAAGDVARAEPAQKDEHLLDELVTVIDREMGEWTFGMESIISPPKEHQTRRPVKEEQYVIFTLAGVRYAALAANVHSVGEIMNLTMVPNVPSWLLGVTNLRGDILSIVDLRAFLELESSDEVIMPAETEVFGTNQEILIVHSRRDTSLIATGLIVDEINDIRYLATERIEEPNLSLKHQLASYISGVYEDEAHLLIIFDLERLLLSPQMRQFEPI